MKEQNFDIKIKKPPSTLRFVAIAAGKILSIIICIFLAMWIWNMTIPCITGWSRINFRQTLGLAAICHILSGKLVSLKIDRSVNDNRQIPIS